MDTKSLEKFAQSARRQLQQAVAARLERVLSTDSAELRAKEKTIRELEAQIATSSRQAVVEQVAYTWFNRFCALRYMDVKHYTRVGIVSPATSPTGEAHTQPEILQEAKQGVIDERFRRTVDMTAVSGLLSGRVPANDPQQQAYRRLLVGACNAYHAVMPFMFEKIDDYSELLMPDDLLSEHSILQATRAALTTEACTDVEVIGWLYQFYISEKKDAVMGRKGAVPSADIPAVTQLFTPHWIVRYMVENSLGRLWMLNHPNSRLIERMDYYVSGQGTVVSGQGTVVSGQGTVARDHPLTTDNCLLITAPEEIRLCDPAVGSGHILTYAFDLLYAIYEEQGYNPVDIPRLILEKNLSGIEIDPRAGALAGFALMMKAREKDARFFRRNVQPDICIMADVTFTPQELDAYMDAVGRDLFTQKVEEWLGQFEQATTFGALIRPLVTDTAMIRRRLEEVGVFQNLFLSHTHDKLRAVLRMSEALRPRYHVVVANPPYMGSRGMPAELKDFARDQYPDSKSDLCTMFIERNLELVRPKGLVGMITMMSWMFLSSFEGLRKRLLDQETIETMAHLGPRAFDTIGGEVVSTTTFTLRRQADTDYKGQYFRLIDGDSEAEKAQMLLDDLQTDNWELTTNYYRASAVDFKKIPGAPIAYWVSDQVREIFNKASLLESLAEVKHGLSTGKNAEVVRYWFEVPAAQIGFSFPSAEEAHISEYKWFPYNKGGAFRKWYGNQEFVLRYDQQGLDLMATFPGHRHDGRSHYFRSGVTWTFISSSNFAARYSPQGFVFDVAGSSLFAGQMNKPILAFLCSQLAPNFLKALNPTLNFQVGNLRSLPILKDRITEREKKIRGIANNGIKTVQLDWDAFETSWNFRILPLLDIYNPNQGRELDGSDSTSHLSNVYIVLRNQWQSETKQMYRIEEENNRLFLDAYGLEDELTPEVPLSEITLTCNPHYRYGSSRLKSRNWAALCERFPETCQQLETISADLAPDMPEEERLGLEQRLLEDTMKAFISYAVGCMFGRYSLDRPGLILANQGETVKDYVRKVSGQWSVGSGQEVVVREQGTVDSERATASSAYETEPLTTDHRSLTTDQHITFMPDEDNVIPMLDGDWFPDDISERFKKFLRVTFGAAHYEENLAFIELAIGRDIRGYFLRDFYDDHVKTYSKRPIYWLFSSPDGSFNALVYMHRYRPDTASIVLNNYLREFRAKLVARKRHLAHVESSAASIKRDKAQAIKEIAQIVKILNELKAYEDQVLYPLATQQVAIDLDDGVLVNYNKFGKALAHVRGLSGKK